MILSENDQIISDQRTIADTMNKHFVNITKKLKLKPTEIVKKNWIGTKTTKILEASNE